MIRLLKIGLLACCGILLAESQSPQTTDMAGARANVSNETIEGLVRDVACPIQNLDNHATSMGGKCVQDCVKGGSPLVILTKDDRLYFPISATRCPIRINGRYSCRLSASTCGRAGLCLSEPELMQS